MNHFNYAGAVGATQDPDCRACASAVAKFCIARPQDPNHNVDSCGLCAAVKKGRCDSHGRGLKTALDEHKMGEKGAQERFEELKAMVLAEASALPASVRVSVHIAASTATPEQVETGAFPRELVLTYRQLDRS